MPVNVPVAPAPLSVMVSVSVAPLLLSAMRHAGERRDRGFRAWWLCGRGGDGDGRRHRRIIVGDRGGGVDGGAGAGGADVAEREGSWSCWCRGAGGRRENQRVEFAGDGRGRRRRQGVDAAVAAAEAGAAQRSGGASAAERDGERVGGAAVAVGDLTPANGATALRSVVLCGHGGDGDGRRHRRIIVGDVVVVLRWRWCRRC